MNLLETILQAQGGGAVRQVAQQFGLQENQAASAISSLLPALAGGLKNNVNQQGGLESLLGALGSGNHGRYLENPALLGQAETAQEGNGILGHILGSKDVSRQVAAQASQQTGLGADIMKKMLPVVATMLMGSLSKQTSSMGTQGQAAAPSSNILGMLSPLLDTNKDGSAADDIIGMVGKLFQR